MILTELAFYQLCLEKVNRKKHEFLYWEFPAYGGQQAVRLGKWKGIRKSIFKDSMHIQLYNLENDIQELNDVSGKYPGIVTKNAIDF